MERTDAQHLALGPRPVEQAEAPQNPGVGVGIAAVERVLVVEVYERRIRLLRRARPLDHLLAPQHPQVVVDGARGAQLLLGGVPQRIMRCAGFPFVSGIGEGARVGRVRTQRGERPGRQGSGEGAGIPAARPVPLEADVAPGDSFVQKRLDVFAGAEKTGTLAAASGAQPLGAPAGNRVERCRRQVLDRDVAEMKVRREARRMAVPRGTRRRAQLQRTRADARP